MEGFIQEKVDKSEIRVEDSVNYIFAPLNDKDSVFLVSDHPSK